ncbi:hypothetical protein BH11PSE11_BH11PSE11_21430 [soil metagenome]
MKSPTVESGEANLAADVLRQRVVWSLIFAVLIVAAIAFSLDQMRLVVIHSPAEDDSDITAFNRGLLAGLDPHARISLRSLRITSRDADPRNFCESVHYALQSMKPSLLVAVGGKAQTCLLNASSAKNVPSLLAEGSSRSGTPAPNGNLGFVAHELPADTWSQALQSQLTPGKPYRVLFLAADSAAGRAEQQQFAALAIPGATISTSLVKSWPQWRGMVEQAAGKFDLLIISRQNALENLPAHLQASSAGPKGVVALTRALFGDNIAATEVESVIDGATWAIEPEPYSLGIRAASAGTALLNGKPDSALPPQTILISLRSHADPQHPPLPALFEVVARNQGLLH